MKDLHSLPYNKIKHAEALLEQAEQLETQMDNIYLSDEEYNELSKMWDSVIKQAKQLLK